MAKHRRNRERRPARRTATRNPKRRILVLCEGIVTEPNYFNAYKKWCRNPLVDVEIPKIHGVPRTLVEEAKERKQVNLKQARRERDENIRYDEIWCVFDVDEHPKLDEAKNMAQTNGIELAISNPCFELWLLLHFRESPGARHRHDLQALMRDHVADYDKHIQFHTYASGFENADQRAFRLETMAEEDQESGRNPSTGVYRLTRSIGRRDDTDPDN